MIVGISLLEKGLKDGVHLWCWTDCGEVGGS